MDLMPEERADAFRAAVAEQERQRWLASIDARIKAFSEHARRSDAQKARWALARIRAAIRADGRDFVIKLRLAVGGVRECDETVWRLNPYTRKWERVAAEQTIIGRAQP